MQLTKCQGAFVQTRSTDSRNQTKNSHRAFLCTKSHETPQGHDLSIFGANTATCRCTIKVSSFLFEVGVLRTQNNNVKKKIKIKLRRHCSPPLRPQRFPVRRPRAIEQKKDIPRQAWITARFYKKTAVPMASSKIISQ